MTVSAYHHTATGGRSTALLDLPTAPPPATAVTYDDFRLCFEEIGRAFREETADAWEQGRFPWELWRAIAASGLFVDAALPETKAVARLAPALDGLSYGLGQFGALIAPIVHAAMAIPTIRDHAEEPLRSHLLDRMQRGDELLAFAITEPQGGTAAFVPETRIDRAGDHYLLHGRKWHITNAPDATMLVVWASDPEADDIAAVLVERDWDGVEIVHECDPVGTCSAPVASIELDDVTVPADHILARGSGRRALTNAMLAERLVGPFAALGVMRHMTEMAVDFVLGREVMGAPLATHQHLQRRIVDLRMRLDLTTALARDALARAAAGERYKAAASELKMYGVRQLMEGALECAQVMGSYGAQREAGLARAALDGLCATIAGGTEEAHQTVIFREMVREHQARRSEA